MVRYRRSFAVSFARNLLVSSTSLTIDVHSSGKLAAYLFDVRGPHAILALHVNQATLVLLRLTTDPGTKRTTASHLRELPAAGCTVAASDRFPVQDLLVDRPDGTRVVLAADGLERSAGVESIAFRPAQERGDAALGARPRPAADLCLEALAKVLPFEAFVQLRDAVSACETRGRELVEIERFLAGNGPRSTNGAEPIRSAGRSNCPTFSNVHNGLASLLRSSTKRAGGTGNAARSVAIAPPAGLQFEGALLALHLLAQRLLLEIGGRRPAREIGRVVANLAAAAGFAGWMDFYARNEGSSAAPVSGTPYRDLTILPKAEDLQSLSFSENRFASSHTRLSSMSTRPSPGRPERPNVHLVPRHPERRQPGRDHTMRLLRSSVQSDGTLKSYRSAVPSTCIAR